MMDPLPDRGARDLGRRGVFHQAINRDATVAGDPGFDVLHRHANVGAHPGFRALALAGGQQLFGGNWRIRAPGDRELIRLIAQYAVKHRHSGIRQPRVGDPGAIVTVVRLQLFIGGDFAQHLTVAFGIFARDKRRHAAHRKRTAFVAGLNQQP